MRYESIPDWDKTVAYTLPELNEESSLDRLVRLKNAQRQADFVTYSESFDEVLTLIHRLHLKNDGEHENPFRIRFIDGKWTIEYLHPNLRWAKETTKRITESPILTAEIGALPESAVDTYDSLINQLKEKDGMENYFDNQEILIIGADNELKEARYILDKFKGVKRVVIAEISLNNIKTLLRNIERQGLQDKIEVMRVNFTELDKFLGDTIGRFGAIFSKRLFEHSFTGYTHAVGRKAWAVMQAILKRPGFFVGDLELQREELVLASKNDSIQTFIEHDTSARLISVSDQASLSSPINDTDNIERKLMQSLDISEKSIYRSVVQIQDENIEITHYKNDRDEPVPFLRVGKFIIVQRRYFSQLDQDAQKYPYLIVIDSDNFDVNFDYSHTYSWGGSTIGILASMLAHESEIQGSSFVDAGAGRTGIHAIAAKMRSFSASLTSSRLHNYFGFSMRSMLTRLPCSITQQTG